MILRNRSNISARRKLLLSLSFFCLFALVIGISVYFLLLRNNSPDSYTGLELPSEQISYEAVDPEAFDIELLAEDLGTITRIKISPDGEYMLVTELSGKVWVFRKEGGNFIKQEEPFYELDTGYTGFPVENGLTGMEFSADFENDKQIFLLYAINLGSAGAKNRISKLDFSSDSKANIIGKNAEVIFESNRDAAGAHQIQNAVGLMIQGKAHLLFTLGENFSPSDSPDITREAGKFMLIQNDGSDPLGKRPFPEYPKIAAKGIRNVYGFDIDPNDEENRIAFVDNGPQINDRLGYVKLVDFDGELAGGEDFGWNGDGESLIEEFPDKYIDGNPNTILYNWETTVSPNEILFYPGARSIQESTNETSSALTLLFGRTGTNENEVGKQIGYFEIDRTNIQPIAEYFPLIQRKESVTETAGNPLGLDFDPVSLDIYFGDLVEGRIYVVKPK